MSGDYYGHPRLEMHARVPLSAKRILDIGCGAGAFGAGLKERRPRLEVWGIEYDSEAARRAEEVLDRVLVGDAVEQASGLDPGSFDAIVMNDILEHLLEPAALLTAVRPLLAAGGRIVVSLPNVRYFHNVVDLAVRGRWDYTDEGICDRTHIRFFTRASMVALLEEAGYRVLSVQGINPTGAVAFRLCNLLTLGRWADMRWLQFALTAAPTGTNEKADPSP